MYTYIFGAYDRLDASDMVLPNGVDGFFYTHPGECDQATAASLRRSGWQVVFTPPLAATKHTAGNRLTSKRHKWLWPWEVQGYDYVLTHDGNVRIGLGSTHRMQYRRSCWSTLRCRRCGGACWMPTC